MMQFMKNDVLKSVYIKRHSTKSHFTAVAVVCLYTLITFAALFIRLASILQGVTEKMEAAHEQSFQLCVGLSLLSHQFTGLIVKPMFNTGMLNKQKHHCFTFTKQLRA